MRGHRMRPKYRIKVRHFFIFNKNFKICRISNNASIIGLELEFFDLRTKIIKILWFCPASSQKLFTKPNVPLYSTHLHPTELLVIHKLYSTVNS